MDPRIFACLFLVFLACGCLQSAEKTQTTTTVPPVDSVSSTVWQEPTTTTMKTFCIDSDGFNVFSKGRTGGFYNGIEYEKSDGCLSEGQVGEWVCDNKTDYAVIEPTDCPDKYVCNEGMCVRPEDVVSPTTTMARSSSSITALFTEKELSPGTVLYATEAGGRLVYSVDSGLKTGRHLVYDGKDEGIQYESAKDPVEVGGKLAYVAGNLGRTLIVWDKKEYGREYDTCMDPADVGGKLAFAASTRVNATTYNYIVYNGEEIPVKYASVKKPFGVAGHLGFMAYRGLKWFIYYNEEIIGENYDAIDNPVDIAGKLAYEAKELGKSFVVYDGREGKKYDYVYGLTGMEGKLVYVAVAGADNFLVYGSFEDRKGYEAVTKPVGIGGRVYYAAKRSDGRTVLVYDGKEIETDYDSIIPDLVNLNGRLAFIAKRGGKWYLVKEN